MRIRTTAGLGLLATFAGLGAAATSAPADPIVRCQQVSRLITVCAAAGTGAAVDASNGTATVAPSVSVYCPSGTNVFGCTFPSRSLGKTGVDSGTVWIDGVQVTQG